MCTIDWGFVAAWVNAIAALGLLAAAAIGLFAWKAQFLQTRDHDVARRLLRTITDSHIVFDEIRSPVAQFSDADEPIAPPALGEDLADITYRELYARYRARTRHLDEVRKERTAALFEALTLWNDEEEYVARLGQLVLDLAALENEVLAQAMSFVDNMKPGTTEETSIDRGVLFAPADINAADPTNDRYQAAKEDISQHLRRKLRMGAKTKRGGPGPRWRVRRART